MIENILNETGLFFRNFVNQFDENSTLRMGCVAFLVLIIILSIILLGISSQPFFPIKRDCVTKYRKNYPGMYLGSIVLVFSFIMLALLIFGGPFVSQFRAYYYFGIGGLFFIVFITLLVGFLNKNTIEDFQNTAPNPSPQPARRKISNIASGPCIKNGKSGFLINGKCISRDRLLAESPDSETAESCLKKLDECRIKEEEYEREIEEVKREIAMGEEGDSRRPIRKGRAKKISSEDQELCSCDKEEFISRGDRDGNRVGFGLRMRDGATAGIGVCKYKGNDGLTRFGYSHPYFGRKCVSGEQMKKMMKEKPDYANLYKAAPKGFNLNPYQSTQCFGLPRENLLEYDLKCKDKFGKEYGVRTVENFGCPPNDYRGLCEPGYQMGVEIAPNSTRCVPVGTDMNSICNTKFKKEKDNKYLKMGYKDIKFSGCPEGYQRAICDGNYYDGKELIENSTACFDQSLNPDRMCKEKYGVLSFSDKIITDNCKPGTIRAMCANTKTSSDNLQFSNN